MPTFYSQSPPALAPSDAISKDYQSYLVSLSTTGNPNTKRLTTTSPPNINWPLSTNVNSEQLGSVLNVTAGGFQLIDDKVSLKSHCDLFLSVQAAITTAGGYVPPGGFVPNNLGLRTRTLVLITRLLLRELELKIG